MKDNHNSDDFRTILTTEQILDLNASGQTLAVLQAWTRPYINSHVDLEDPWDADQMQAIVCNELLEDTPPLIVYALCTFEDDSSAEEWLLGNCQYGRYGGFDPAYKALPVDFHGMVRLYDMGSSDTPAGLPPFDEYAFWKVLRDIPGANNPAVIVKHRTRLPRDFVPVGEEMATALTEQMVELNLHDPNDPSAEPLFDDLAGEPVIETWAFERVTPCAVLDSREAQNLANLLIKAQVEGRPRLPD